MQSQLLMSKQQIQLKTQKEGTRGECLSDAIYVWESTYSLSQRHLRIKDYSGGNGIAERCETFIPTPWAKYSYKIPLYYRDNNTIHNYRFVSPDNLVWAENIVDEKQLGEYAQQFLQDLEKNPSLLSSYKKTTFTNDEQYLEFIPYHKALVLEEIIAELGLSREFIAPSSNPQLTEPLVSNPDLDIVTVFDTISSGNVIYFFKEGKEYYYRLHTYPDGGGGGWKSIFGSIELFVDI